MSWIAIPDSLPLSEIRCYVQGHRPAQSFRAIGQILPRMQMTGFGQGMILVGSFIIIEMFNVLAFQIPPFS